MQTNKLPRHPEWATKFRTPGTELRFLSNKYYLYEYKTVYDPERKKPKKISGKLIGRITEAEGLITGDKQQLRSKAAKETTITVGPIREWGVSNYLLTHCSEFSQQLKEQFPDCWPQLMLLAYCRLVYQSPIKRMGLHAAQSWLAEHWQAKPLSDKTISLLLREIGMNRQQAVQYMQHFLQKGGAYILADTTHILSKSQHIELSHKGYNNKMDYEPQVNLMYLYASGSSMPVFYRLHAGNIREIKAFKLTLKESGVTDATIIGDKGFFSDANVKMLEDEKLHYILPLRRNNQLIDYSSIESGAIKKTRQYFQHQDRFIWYTVKELENGKRCMVFLDEKLRQKEELDFLSRIESHPEDYKIDTFQEKLPTLGTLAVLVSKMDKTPQEVYQAYKERLEIEAVFDNLKNVIDTDSTYMQNEEALQGWMFINHIALQLYHHISLRIASINLTAHCSVKDLLAQLKEIRKVRINNQWHDGEVTRKTQNLLLKLKI